PSVAEQRQGAVRSAQRPPPQAVDAGLFAGIDLVLLDQRFVFPGQLLVLLEQLVLLAGERGPLGSVGSILAEGRSVRFPTNRPSNAVVAVLRHAGRPALTALAAGGDRPSSSRQCMDGPGVAAMLAGDSRRRSYTPRISGQAEARRAPPRRPTSRARGRTPRGAARRASARIPATIPRGPTDLRPHGGRAPPPSSPRSGWDP